MYAALKRASLYMHVLLFYRLVRLMTAAGGHGAEDVVADLLFVLCKENSELHIVIVQ